MKLLVRFAPFVVLTVLAGLTNWRLGVLAGLTTLIAVTLALKPRRLGVLGGAMLVFFVAAGVLALVSPHAAAGPYLHPAAAAWLALVSTASVIIGRPFTEDLAKGLVSPAIAQSTSFAKINRAMSLRWAATFAAIAGAGFVAAATHRSALGTLVTVGLLLYTARSMTATTAGQSRGAVAEAA